MGRTGFHEKFAKFHNEFKEDPVLILAAKEILALFLNEDKLEYLNIRTTKEYEFGILGGYSVPMLSIYFNGITLLEELADVLPDKIKLSFIAFGCLAPLELLKDIEYIRKAINLDSELEMYKLNLEYYLRDYGLTYKQLVDSDNRFRTDFRIKVS
jgi:hypothetical protein